jgi:UPF0271 protein
MRRTTTWRTVFVAPIICALAGGVLHDPAAIAERVVAMVTTGQVTAIDGAQIAVSVESVCVHGDSPGAVQIATAVRDQLKAAGIDIRSFC